MVDEAGSNWKGLKQVYGYDDKNCQLSISLSAKQKQQPLKLLTDEESEMFTKLSNTLFTAITPSPFMESYDKCLALSSRNLALNMSYSTG